MAVDPAKMIHRFQSFQIDEAQRELRTGDRVIPLQPRVFDLLAYLARNHDRVVPKDELLDVVWPGVIVADNSLQRAVSLARSALASAGAADAIRTFARRGYRLCAEMAQGEAPVGDVARMSQDELHQWAYSAQFAGDALDALEKLERLVTEHRVRGERLAAAWVSVLIGLIRMERRELVLAQGWHRHAIRLLSDRGLCRERGYAEWLGCRLALFSNENELALEQAERCRMAGELCGDAGLEGLGLLGMAEANLFLGRTKEGLAALDEAGAAVIAGGLGTLACGLVYCGVIFCCMTRSDWSRAGQWTEQFRTWGADKGSLGYPGLCAMHRVEVLTVRGELAAAAKEMEVVQRTLPKLAPWTEGDVWRVAGDLHVAFGDLAAAKAAYERAAAVGWDVQFELALLQFLDGDVTGAAQTLDRLISGRAWSCCAKLGRALLHLSIAASQAGDVATASTSLETVRKDAELVSTPALQALELIARAELEVALGRRLAGCAMLRSAIETLRELNAPLAVAGARCRLAHVLLMERDEMAAKLEIQGALGQLIRAGAQQAANRYAARFCAAEVEAIASLAKRAPPDSEGWRTEPVAPDV